MTRRIDTVMLFDELDMLKVRLRELENVPDLEHVIVEAAVDHQGNPKPLWLGDNWGQFEPWHDRMIHIVADLSRQTSPWGRENAQRAAVWEGLSRLSVRGDDIVWLCDVDEIPSQAMVAAEPLEMTAVNMRLSMFAVDWVWPEETRICVMGRASMLEDLGWQRNNGPRSLMPLLHRGGWHFTWLGGPEEIERKARRHCHLELNGLILAGNLDGDWYEEGYTWHGQDVYPPRRRTTRMERATIDETWPVAIREGDCPASWFRFDHRSEASYG
jgi:beta-1,4-mannosyl-glycoprotein beta-1,4-N-acetylglucosaminyltransferase